MKDPELKKVKGIREGNSDGFTYVYGIVKRGAKVRPASATTRRLIRDDKRGIKARVLRRIFNDEEI